MRGKRIGGMADDGIKAASFEKRNVSTNGGRAKMRTGSKRYTTAYKKKIDVDRDTFLPRRSPRGVIQCAGCGAVYHRRRWTFVVPSGAASPRLEPVSLCPACQKIKAHSVSGEVDMLDVDAADRGELVRILRNEEQRAQEKNPLERIMRLHTKGTRWTVETTTEKLAQRLGRAVHKARGGRIAYKWSHNNKFVRVMWQPKLHDASRTGWQKNGR